MSGKDCRPANQDMIDGFRDGYDPDSPEPSDNRSRSYRHGFQCGRDDILKRNRHSVETLRRMADEAMAADEKDARAEI